MSSVTLPSQARTRRSLPSHGYEGRRAEAVARPAPAVAPIVALPPAEELARLGFAFEPVGMAPGPVRLRHNGFPCGVFMSQQAAAPAIRRLAQQ
jgi:hypothetical protein